MSKSSFISPLAVSPLPDGRRWRLVFPFLYHVGSRYSQEVIKVPAEFITDFASIPKFLWWLPSWAKYIKAAVLHDWLYVTQNIAGKPITRKYADQIFLEAMLIEWRHHCSRYVMAYIEYYSVRIFGWLAW